MFNLEEFLSKQKELFIYGFKYQPHMICNGLAYRETALVLNTKIAQEYRQRDSEFSSLLGEIIALPLDSILLLAYTLNEGVNYLRKKKN